jgi:hypothetical protein
LYYFEFSTIKIVLASAYQLLERVVKMEKDNAKDISEKLSLVNIALDTIKHVIIYSMVG